MNETMDGQTAINTRPCNPEFAEQQHPGKWRLAEVQDVLIPTPAIQLCVPFRGLLPLQIKQTTEPDVTATIAAIHAILLPATPPQVAFVALLNGGVTVRTIQQRQRLGLTEADLTRCLRLLNEGGGMKVAKYQRSGHAASRAGGLMGPNMPRTPEDFP